jgi:hypothetical protein
LLCFPLAGLEEQVVGLLR